MLILVKKANWQKKSSSLIVDVLVIKDVLRQASGADESGCYTYWRSLSLRVLFLSYQLSLNYQQRYYLTAKELMLLVIFSTGLKDGSPSEKVGKA